MNDFNKRALALGEDRVTNLIELGIVMRNAVKRGASDNSCRNFIANELKLSKEEMTLASLLSRFPLATYKGCTTFKEAKVIFETAKGNERYLSDVAKEKARKSKMTATEILEEEKRIREDIAYSKANIINDTPNKVATVSAGLKSKPSVAEQRKKEDTYLV